MLSGAKLERTQLSWSPDGQFISLLDAELGGDTIELVRVLGAATGAAVLSTRIEIGPPGDADSISSWPPMFP